MSTHVDAILAYGYDLGGPSRWNLRGVDAGKEPEFSWWDSTDDLLDFAELAMQELDAHRRDPGVDLVGVQVAWYGSDTRHGAGIGFILSAHTYFAYYDRALSLAVLDRDLVADSAWNERLGHALRILDINPRGVAPRWILAASHRI